MKTPQVPAMDGMSPLGFRQTATCDECGRVFDLTHAIDADEWTFGHDCEAPDTAHTAAEA